MMARFRNRNTEQVKRIILACLLLSVTAAVPAQQTESRFPVAFQEFLRLCSDSAAYALENLDGAPVLLVSEESYLNPDGFRNAVSAQLFGLDASQKLVALGEVRSQGTHYPLMLSQGSLLAAGHNFVYRYRLKGTPASLEITESAQIIYSKKGKASYNYENRETDTYTTPKDDQIFSQLTEERMQGQPIAFTLNVSTYAQDRAAHLRDLLYHSRKECLVVSHRGDWRYAPENSLEAFQSCIDMGVDMVELDLKMTKDSVLIICHDGNLDRTTNAKGAPANYTWAELREHKLINPHGGPTRQDIPTLEEVLNLCKGRILINIDKGYDYFKQVYQLLVKTGTLDQVVIKSGHSLRKVRQDNPGVLDKVIYMPVITLDQPGAEQMIDEYATIHPVAVECCFSTYDDDVARLLKKVTDKGMKIWINSLWASLCNGHDDEMAVDEHHPDESWGWLIRQGALLLQTDRPKQMLEYLKDREWHE